jgi:hypothetical protein
MPITQVSLPLPRRSRKSFKHIAHVFIRSEDQEELCDQIEDLREEFSGLEFVASHLETPPHQE